MLIAMNLSQSSKKQRFSFTLLEVVISLVLTGMLLSFLFGFFWHISVAKNQNKILKEKVLTSELCRLRLNHLFSHFNEQKGCFLATLSHPEAIGPALLVYCDQGIDPDAAFSGALHSMLYKTRDNRLCLCRWSKGRIPKVDTLLSKVEDVSYAFFSGKEWTSTWPKKKEKDLASASLLMVKISLLFQGAQEPRQDFIFSLNSGEVLYEVSKI